MDAKRYQDIKALVDKLLELPTEGRTELLGALCPLDDSMRADVGQLLALHNSVPASFLTASHIDDARADLVQRIADDAPEDALPSRLGRFDVRGQIGVGGIGRVLEAWDPTLRRRVAIKMLKSKKASAQARERFHAEAQLTSQLEHPNIVPIHELGWTHDDLLFFVMKRIEGESLRSLIQRRKERADKPTRWTRHRLLTILLSLCNAVAYAHDRGILHRDLKPENIMLGGHGEVLLMDWGLAHLSAVPSSTGASLDVVSLQETQDGAMVGTPGYMSPEQCLAAGDTLSVRSDVWSLGAILFEILTFERAIEGETPVDRMYRTMLGPSPSPRERAPDRRIPEEIAEICSKAMETEPEQRFASVVELQDAIEAFLDGSRRRSEAGKKLKVAKALWRGHDWSAGEETKLTQRIDELSSEVVPWAAVDEPSKAELLSLREQRETLGVDMAATFARAVAAAEQALSHDPTSASARAFLANAYWSRLAAAERRGDRPATAHYLDRVREYDDGQLTDLLEGSGRLTLRTRPKGAEVICERFERQGLAWRLGEAAVLGKTALDSVRLAMGSYVLTLRKSGCRDTIYPVYIGRNDHWKGGEPLPLLSDETIGADFVYVPAGPFQVGGDPDAGNQLPAGERQLDGYLIGRHPVTCGEYARFVASLHAESPEEAWRRTPRDQHGVNVEPLRFWPRLDDVGSEYTFPLEDKDGDDWHEDWPILSISWEDAQTYAAWLGAIRGHEIRLASELEYEKCARGVDGRFFPWGNTFDPAACRMQLSRRGRPQPEPVGSYPLDRSVYGAVDLAGGIREMTRDSSFDGDDSRRVVRGGAWSSTERICRAANRFGLEPQVVHPYLGFRLARSLPDSATVG